LRDDFFAMKGKRRRRVILTVFALVVCPLVLAAIAWAGLTLGGPHRVSWPRATLSKGLQRSVRGAFESLEPKPDSKSLIEAALFVTKGNLHFGLSHRTHLRFDREREGNCVEYAQLFAVVFNRLAARAGAKERAWVVRSHSPRIFGLRIPAKSFREHDWVVIAKRREATHFVDPSFADVGLASDIRRKIRGPVSIPRR
jgi:hypothetical protein